MDTRHLLRAPFIHPCPSAHWPRPPLAQPHHTFSTPKRLLSLLHFARFERKEGWNVKRLSYDFQINYHMIFKSNIIWFSNWLSYDFRINYHMIFESIIIWLLNWLSYDVLHEKGWNGLWERKGCRHQMSVIQVQCVWASAKASSEGLGSSPQISPSALPSKYAIHHSSLNHCLERAIESQKVLVATLSSFTTRQK